MRHIFFTLIFTFFISILFSQNYFPYNVASGDPTASSIVLWTKTIPTNQNFTIVAWEISDSKTFDKVLQKGIDTAFANNDYSLQVLVEQLPADKWLYYRFRVDQNYSPIGRTKTAPINNTNPATFAVISCANYEHGFFNVYKEIAIQNKVEAIIHLGDYIYEYESARNEKSIPERMVEPKHEILTLKDYRTRYAHYRKDKDLQLLHQNFPFINIWDDHEIANNSNSYSANNHDSTEGEYRERMANGKKAFYEWLPIQQQVKNKLYRQISYGKDINFIFLDTRLEERDEQSDRSKKTKEDTNRRMIGDEQFQWVKSNLSKDTSTWNILAQQVIFAPVLFWGKVVNTDQWDGYFYERDRLIKTCVEDSIANLVVLTGDAHSSWANAIPLKKEYRSKDRKNVGVEFVSPSISSKRSITKYASPGLLRSFNKHIDYIDLNKRGFIELSIFNTYLQVKFNYINTIDSPVYEVTEPVYFHVKKGIPELLKGKVEENLQVENPPLVNY